MELSLYPTLLSSFISLCLISSSNYIINDILDVEKDRQHPEKRLRPIASGEIKVRVALIICVAIFALSLLIAYQINFSFFLSLLALFVSSQMYSFIFKKVAVLDVLAISINYVLRSVSGCLSINVRVSPWLIIGILFVALLLALGKRKNELSLLGENAYRHKEVFRVYTKEALEGAVTLTSTLIIITYALYSMNSPTGDARLVLTLPFIVFIVLRYNLLLQNKNPAARRPNELLKDKPILIMLILWLSLLIILLYFAPPHIFEGWR